MPFDLELEKDILSACLRDAEFVSKAYPVLTNFDFSDPTLSWIWRQIADTYAETGEPPSSRILARRIVHDFSAANERRLTAVVCSRLANREDNSPNAALGELRSFVKTAAIRAGAGKALHALRDGDIVEAERATSAAAERAAGTDAPRPLDWARSWKRRRRMYREEPPPVLMLPGNRLNELANGGIPTTEYHIVLVLALTNVGKTMYVVDQGFRSLSDGNPVFHVATEDSPRQTSARYDARFTGIPRHRLDRRQVTDEDLDVMDRKFAEAGEQFFGRLRIHEMSPGDRIETLVPLLVDFRKEHPEGALTIMLDSINHMGCTKPVRDKRQEATEVIRVCKRIVKDRRLQPCVIFATDFVPARFEGKTVPVDQAASESTDKIRISSFAFVLSEAEVQTSEEGKNLEAKVLKNRIGAKKKYVCYLEVDGDTCTFKDSKRDSRPLATLDDEYEDAVE